MKFVRPAPVSRQPIALRSHIEGSRTRCTPAEPCFIERFASPDLLSHTAESAADCSLHRRASVASVAVWSPENAQTSPIIATIEAAAEDAASGGAGDAQRGQIDEGCRRARPPPPLGGLRPPLGLRDRREAQGRRRAGLPAHTGGPDSRRTAGRAARDAGDAATDGALCASEPTFIRACTCSSVYSSAVTGASQLYI